MLLRHFWARHPFLKDILSVISFVVCVIIGTIVINTFIFRSYNVVGISMENTLEDDDRVIVNRFAVTWAHFLGQEYVPERGDIIVFTAGSADGDITCEAPSDVTDQYIIKRVIAFAGEEVVVKNGVLTVYNDEYPEGFQPDLDWYEDDGTGPKTYTSGDVDIVVPEGELFVAGDNREGSNSTDSRSGLGTIPLCRVIGPVALRIYPFDSITVY